MFSKCDDNLTRYYQGREVKLVEIANARRTLEVDIEATRAEREAIDLEVGLSVFPMARNVNDTEMSVVDWTAYLDILMCEEINSYRAEYFSELYGITLAKDHPFIEALGQFEFRLVSTLRPSLADIEKCLSGEVEVRRFFGKNMLRFVELEQCIGMGWLFEVGKTKRQIKRGVGMTRSMLKEIESMIESRYETLIQPVRSQEVKERWSMWCIPCFCCDIGEEVSGIYDVLFAHKAHIHTKPVVSSFNEMVEAYYQMECELSESSGMELQVVQADERSALLANN